MFILLHLFNSFLYYIIKSRIGPHDQISSKLLFSVFFQPWHKTNGIAGSFIMGKTTINAVDMRDETVFARRKTERSTLDFKCNVSYHLQSSALALSFAPCSQMFLLHSHILHKQIVQIH